MAKAKTAAKTKKSGKAVSTPANPANSPAKSPVKSSPKSPAKSRLQKKKRLTASSPEQARVISSEVVYQGPLFRVTKDNLIEPSGKHSTRDVVRHNGSVVILAVDSAKPGKSGKSGKKSKDPWIVMERQFRHAAGRFLWELPAGKIDAGRGSHWPAPSANSRRRLATGLKNGS